VAEYDEDEKAKSPDSHESVALLSESVTVELPCWIDAKATVTTDEKSAPPWACSRVAEYAEYVPNEKPTTSEEVRKTRAYSSTSAKHQDNPTVDLSGNGALLFFFRI
jgi:hypothetical protein